MQQKDKSNVATMYLLNGFQPKQHANRSSLEIARA
jgi:hypothetical protein